MAVYTTPYQPQAPSVNPGKLPPPTGGGSSSNDSSSNWHYGPANPYDPRIGNGPLPQGMWGSQNRAYVRNTNPNELVSHSLNGLLDENGQYIQSAIRHANEISNGRGLLNSSMAAGAAQRAAIDAALPIAQGDATAFQNTAEQNQRWLNQQQMALEANQTSRANAGSANQAALEAARYGDDTRLQMQRESLAYGGEQQGLDRAFQDYMATRGFQNNLGLLNQGYQNQMGNNLFDLSRQMMLGNQQFGYQFALNGMNNPAVMGNPQAAAGYVNYWQNGYLPQIDAILSQLFGGGHP